MSETLSHPSPERLHGFVEASLDAAEHAAVDRHVVTCGRCQSEVEELRSLFAAFSELPTFAPSAGFADRVMTRVRVRRPARARAAEWAGAWAGEWAGALERLMPRSTRGWAAASGLFALPVLAITALAWWLLSQPGVSPQSLWMIASTATGDAFATAGQWLWAQLAGSTAAVYVSRLVELADSVGRGGIGLAAVMFATATAASIYVLYQNLFRTNPRRTEHASYVF